MHSNLLWGTLSSLIKVYSYSKILLVISPLTWVTVIYTSLFDVCTTVPAQGNGVRGGSVSFLGASLIPSELQIEQNLFAVCQHTNSE